MEGNNQNRVGSEENSREALPSLIKTIIAKEVAGFDSVKEHRESFSQGIEGIENDAVSKSKRMTHSISISMPSSPIEGHVHKSNHVFFKDNNDTVLCHAMSSYSQPIPKNGKLKSFDSFKTWSGKLDRQLFRGKVHQESKEELRTDPLEEIETPPVERYFDALEGPELDTLKASEEIILPKDKLWPFLLRFPISSFGICLGLSSHAIMWKTLASSNSTKFLHVISPYINLALWFVSIFFVTIISFIYSLKVILYFEAIRREFNHPIRVNFFFAPWIAILFLVLGVPPSISRDPSPSLWYIFMMPIFFLEVKIYGQWMSGGERRLSKVANPSNHLSILGNFVGALLGASMGLKEGPIFFFAIGLAHYVVLFVTLYQRLPTNKTLPKELHPVFFLFVAAPNVASMAWARIQGSFDYGARLAYFIALFLYFSLVVRVNFFRGFRFSLGWWAYTFPMTGAAIATIKYSNAVTNIATKSLALVLCIVATLVVVTLLVTTIIHAFVLRDLFPNDIAIAISERKPRLTTRRWYHRRSSSSDINVEPYLKCSNSDDTDIEASLGSKCSNNYNQDLSKNDTQNIYYDKRSDVS